MTNLPKWETHYTPVAGHTSTLSKSPDLFPESLTPLLVGAVGSMVMDSDGHVYTDWISGLLAITLGHGNVEVNGAVIEHLRLGGPTWSLAHPLESEVAETILRLTDYDDGQVRFFKSGSEANTAAVRIARAVTGRNVLVTSGYHGWHDPLLVTPPAWGRAPGVMSAVRSVPFNDYAAVERCFLGLDPDDTEHLNRERYDTHAGVIAAVIVEPETTEAPKDGYLQGLRALCDKHGAVLIFDECITGARYPQFTAARHYGVQPDLLILSKGLANGWPLACVVGKRQYMRVFDVDWHPDYTDGSVRGPVYCSGTWAGETSGLAAASATLKVWERDKIAEKIRHTGETLRLELRNALSTYPVEGVAIKGPSYRLLLETPSLACKTHIMACLLEAGILIGTGFNVTAAHTQEDVARTVREFARALNDWREGAIRGGRPVAQPYRQA